MSSVKAYILRMKKKIDKLRANDPEIKKMVIEMDEIVELKLLQKSFELLTEIKNKKTMQKYQTLIELLDRQFLLNKYDNFLHLKKEIAKKD